MPFNRILLKLSGEAFGGPAGRGLDVEAIERIAREVKGVADLGVEVAVVVGGGNMLRGAELEARGMGRAGADTMGMLATAVNALAFQDALERRGRETRVLTAIEMRTVAEPYIRRRALRHLEKGRIVILAGGTGNPFFTTDTTAALRGAELEVDALLKATHVDGVYAADPRVDPKAERFDRLSYLDVLNRRLKVMDATAITLCMEHRLPIVVFDLGVDGNIARVVKGQPVGTRIEP
ncbi:MAG TPA: UMP kinase [Planctomycetota bacterium]|nr:UMP kinase [Planctomycetota bacterium]